MWKTVREVVFRFSYWEWQQEKRKTRSFFVFLTAIRSKKNELTVYTRTLLVVLIGNRPIIRRLFGTDYRPTVPGQL